MIYRKGKITLSAAKIINQKLAFRRKVAVNILNIFKETAYLSELVLFFIVYSARLVANTKLDEEAFVSAKNMILFSVVGLGTNSFIRPDTRRDGVSDLSVTRKDLLARLGAFEFGIAKGGQNVDLRMRKCDLADRLGVVVRNILLYRFAVFHERHAAKHYLFADLDTRKLGFNLICRRRLREDRFFQHSRAKRVKYKLDGIFSYFCHLSFFFSQGILRRGSSRAMILLRLDA